MLQTGERKVKNFRTKLSVVIIAKNEEGMIGEAIKSALWADEVLVIDDNSVDKTVNIAKKMGARIVCSSRQAPFQYAKLRNDSINLAKKDWIFYLDCDERITPALTEEIKNFLRNVSIDVRCLDGQITAYAVSRHNFYLGKRVKYGGSYPDYVKRFFYRPALEKWIGKLHEEPIFRGKLGYLKNSLRHYTHRDLTSMMKKTIEWSKLEAEELYKANHPPATWWRMTRMMLTELWNRGIKLQGFRDGTVGVIEVIFQMYSRFITYARLWELQSKAQKVKC